MAGVVERAVDARLHVAVPNHLQALDATRLAVLQFLAPWHLSEALIFRIELVLEEILVNAMTYAFPEGGAHTIDLWVAVDPDAIVLGFEDRGIPFNPHSVHEPPAAATLDSASPGGRGLMLVRKFARQLDYQRSEGRNWLRIEIARH